MSPNVAKSIQRFGHHVRDAIGSKSSSTVRASRKRPFAKRKYALGRQPHWDRICWMEQTKTLVTASCEFEEKIGFENFTTVEPNAIG
jgi:hypothetical protein